MITQSPSPAPSKTTTFSMFNSSWCNRTFSTWLSSSANRKRVFESLRMYATSASPVLG